MFSLHFISVRYLLTLLSALFISLSLLSGCSRSPLSGSANYNCGEGDRVISLERLFCVYTSTRRARPEMSAGEEALTDMGIGDEAGAEAGDRMLDPLCPAELPMLYVYDTLYICAAEDALSLEVIESVVASWSSEYFPENQSSTSSSRDAGISDEGIGIVRIRDMDIITDMTLDMTLIP